MSRRLVAFVSAFALVGLLTYFCALNLINYQQVLSKKISKPKKPGVQVSARVGHYKINFLSGWSSPFSEITLSSGNLFRKTSADEAGFFVFYSIPIENRNLCLIAQDVNMLPSFPLCLAPLPQTEDIEVENILLSPTISLEGEKIALGKTAKASGMTFPDAVVDVYLFTNPTLSFWSRISQGFKSFFQLSNSKILKTAYAMTLPKYKIKSNANGYFEFSLPAVNSSTDRVFATASLPETLVKNLTDPRSPKSNTLSFRAVSIFDLLTAFFAWVWESGTDLKLNWTLVIILEILLLFLLALLILFTKKKKEEKQDNTK